MRKILTLCLFFLSAISTSVFGQWEIYGGYSQSNFITYLNGQGTNNLDPIGAPNTLSNFHFGVAKNFSIVDRLFLNVGLGYAGRGTSDFARSLISDSVYVHRLMYVQAPISLHYQVIKDRGFMVFLGLTPSYLIKQSEFSPGFPVLPTAVEFQVEYRLGFRLPIYKNFSGGISFSRSITQVDRIESNVPIYEFKSYNHAFDFSLIYKF